MNKFEITRRINNEFQFNLKAKNGEIILTSEGYTTKHNCIKGIESVKENSQLDERFDRKVATNGKPYFNLKAANHEIIGTGQMYESESGRETGIESVKKNAPDAEIIDLTTGHEADESGATGLGATGLGATGLGATVDKAVDKTVDKVISTPNAVVDKFVSENLPPVTPITKVVEETVDKIVPPSSKIASLKYAAGNGNNGTGAPKKKCFAWWKLLLLLLALGLLLFFVWRSCSDKPIGITKPEIGLRSVTGATDRIATDLSLPNGVVLHAFKGGIEDQLIAFLQSKDYESATEDQLKEKWFNFDNIDFKFASGTELMEGSQAQLDNVTKILKYFPNVKVKFGAYTDKVGDEQDNIKLSAKRAETIKAIFENNGITSQIVETEGYGEKFATHAEDAPDKERALDRKVALRFVK